MGGAKEAIRPQGERPGGTFSRRGFHFLNRRRPRAAVTAEVQENKGLSLPAGLTGHVAAPTIHLAIILPCYSSRPPPWLGVRAG
jgi:hypothetical protein